MNDSLVELPGYVLRRAASTSVADLNQRLSDVRLRHADVAFLMLINASAGITQSEAGRILDIKRANMVPLVARLERRRLLNRKQVDGRSKALALTAQGRATLTKARQIVGEFETDLMQRVPETMRPLVLPILTALWNRTDD